MLSKYFKYIFPGGGAKIFQESASPLPSYGPGQNRSNAKK